MEEYRIRAINTGYVLISAKNYQFHHSVHTYLRDVSLLDSPLPVYCFLVENDETKILVDTGMSDTERANKYHHSGSWQEDGQDVCSQLTKIGIMPEEIDAVIFTHLHWDHCFNMKAFSRAKYYAHDKEYSFAMDPLPLYYRSYEHPFLGIESPFYGVEFNTFSEETELFPGIRVIETFGHSPGHVCVEVDTRDGKYIIGGDVAFRQENFDAIPELGYEVTPPSRYVDVIDSYNSIAKIKKRAADPQHILLCHDVGLIERMRQNPVIG